MELGARSLHENCRHAGKNGPENRHHDDHLHQRVAPLPAAQSPDNPPHAPLERTSASALVAVVRLWLPTPHSASARLSTWISACSASAPCHHPKRAPATT